MVRLLASANEALTVVSVCAAGLNAIGASLAGYAAIWALIRKVRGKGDEPKENKD